MNVLVIRYGLTCSLQRKRQKVSDLYSFSFNAFTNGGGDIVGPYMAHSMLYKLGL